MIRQARKKQAQSFVELVVGMVVLIPIVLVLFDLTVIVIAVQVNDSTCRDAARLAASGDPTQAQIRAGAAVARANSNTGGMLSKFRLVSVVSTVTAAQIQALQPYGGSLKGTIRVVTEATVTPFIVQWAYSGGAPLKFRSQQTFPFTYVVPNQATYLPQAKTAAGTA